MFLGVQGSEFSQKTAWRFFKLRFWIKCDLEFATPGGQGV